jgi:hypothetical protein
VDNGFPNRTCAKKINIRRAFEATPGIRDSGLHHGAPALATGERRDMIADA